jgi:hypothetical protein
VTTLEGLSTGDKIERTDHANGYNPNAVRSTGMPYIAERSDKPFNYNPELGTCYPSIYTGL